ncbi:RagB/SusD family nutrient uptake outer membrane protein [Dyadobacter sp. CY345]|uniref:RagB/SusD family nutrient uptake outer membrane protein n=1 Tax=Dyadobacter sp. CY345 TaxID=2909335 RepID=UPI001F3B28F1|nr:RagB/SusD family nutrient uptake outer membrane protein [Dyadobacter sp. CY345]MCF2443926.1 RagB/SusD family nutrient uptake outer membrane protein [Dyadobacter sp. CY345]
MKFKHIYLIPFLAIALASCSEDFTDLNPVSQRNVNGFYLTANDMNTAINAAYKVLQNTGAYNQSYWIMQEMRSDNTDQGPDGTGLGADLTVIDNFSEIATSEIITAAYTDSYLGIARSNIVLDRIEPITMDGALKERIKSEALFLRSLFYYNLAISFGNIPMPLNEPASVSEGGALPQLPASEIYKQITADLIKAEAGLPIKYTTTADIGRATKGAAAALLAKIYLTMGDKTAAIPVLQRIITSYGYSLLPNYANLWGIANKNNAESIFEVQYKGGGTGTGNTFTNAFSPLLRQTTGAYKNRPTVNMMRAYEPGDDRFLKSMDSSYVNAQGVLISSSKNDMRFITKYGKENAFNENDASYNFVVLRYADVLLMLAEALGESEEAYGYINQVRARAKLSPINAATAGTFEDKLLQERRVELAFENHRWADLLRFGKAAEILKAQGKTARLLYLIPQRELDINGSFKQN